MKRILVLFAVIVLSIGCNNFLPTAPDLGQVTSPTGGEVWQTGSTQTISWTGQGYSVKVYVDIGAGTNRDQLAVIGGGPTPGSFSWKVGTTPFYGPDTIAIAPGQHTIRVCNTGGEGITSGRECVDSAPFTIE